MSPRGPATKARLSTVQLGTGLTAAGATIVIMSYFRLVEYWVSYAVPLPTRWAWVGLGVIGLSSVLWLRWRSARLSGAAFAVIAGLLLVCAGMDIAGVWDAASAHVYPTAAVAVGGMFLALSTLRPTWELVVCTALLAVGFTIIGVRQSFVAPETAAPENIMAAFALVPLIIGTGAVGIYRRMVTQALDRVLLHSALRTPAIGYSADATRRLTALDREVEDLFSRISQGLEPLPLSPESARRAGEIATELRSHLIAGHQKTWLVDAVAESSVLVGRVEIRDEDGLATLWDDVQREGLLSAIWLLLVTDGDTSPTAEIDVLGVFPGPEHDELHVLITLTGLTRLEIEPATWPGLDRNGRYGVNSTATGVQINLRSQIR